MLATAFFEDDWDSYFTRFLYFWLTVIHACEILLDQLEASINNHLIKTQPYLPHVARLCVISTFIDDGFRKWTKWDAHKEILEEKWNFGWHLSTLLIFYDVFGQFIPAILIISRKYVSISCGILTSILLFHVVAYSNISFTSIIAVSGALFLYDVASDDSLMAFFSQTNNENLQLEDTRVLLFGRVWLGMMYCCLEMYCLTFFSKSMLIPFVMLVLNVPIYFKYKTRFSTLIVILWIFGFNLWFNSWWMVPTDYFYRDLMKFYFFQGVSVIGGFLILIAYGFDGICLDVDGRRID